MMCKKHNLRKIDKCLKEFVDRLDCFLTKPWRTIACCCGHGKYPMTIIVKEYNEGQAIDLVSGKVIPRKKRFYRKDKQGYYYIPETLECEE